MMYAIFKKIMTMNLHITGTFAKSYGSLFKVLNFAQTCLRYVVNKKIFLVMNQKRTKFTLF